MAWEDLPLPAKAGKHTFSALKGAALVRLGTLNGVLVHPGKFATDWTEANTDDGLALTIELPDRKPKAEAEHTPPPFAPSPL